MIRTHATRLAATASAAVLLIGLAACSSSSTPTSGSSSAPATSKSAAPASSATTYTEDDLTSILTAVDTKFGTKGKILDDAALKAAQSKLGGSSGISAILDQAGVTLSPAACKAQIANGLTLTPPTGTVSADLVMGSNTLGVATVSGKALPTAITDGSSEKKADALLKECSDMTISVQGQSLGLALSKSDLTTDADRTVAIDEKLTLPAAAGGGTTTITSVTAIQGNLIIFTTSFGKSSLPGMPTPSANAPTPQEAVNAVVAAAKK